MATQTARIRGQVREMGAATVEQLIGQSQMAAIRAFDPNPFFISMVIAHVGTSRGEVVGFGAKLKEWGARVIRAVADAFNPSGRVPAKIFDGFYNWHGNQAARVPVGDVVFSRVADVDGVEGAETIGWIYPGEAALRNAIANGDRDCCSLEGDVIFASDGGKLIVTEFERGKAVVLGHTSKQLPGFPGAIVRALAEFGPGDPEGGGSNEDPPPPDPPPTPPNSGAPVVPEAGLTKEQVIAGARSLGLGAADFGFASAPVAPATANIAPSPNPPAAMPPAIPAPPAQATKPETKVDLANPKFNAFL